MACGYMVWVALLVGWLLRFVCAYIKVLVDFVVLDWSCAC